MAPQIFLLIFASLLLSIPTSISTPPPRICVIGSGITGSSLAHFIKHYTCSSQARTQCLNDIHVFERRGHPGGRMATVTIGGDVFEAGASIIHPKNLHALHFASLLNLPHKPKPASGDDDSWFGIWNGEKFIFKTLPPPPPSSSALYRKLYSLLNSLLIFKRYGFSLLKMNAFVKGMLEKFLGYYKGLESRPVFATVEEMLQWSKLYELTQQTLQEALQKTGLSAQLISELVTVITRINYGQSVSISGLAGAVSLAGSDDGLWSVEGGNWRIAAGLLNHSDVNLYLNEEIISVSYTEGSYSLKSKAGNDHNCEITVIATPLDELNISFTPPVSIPSRRLQHTFTTFVRGLINPKFFGLKSASEVPDLVGTIERPDIPFSCISVLKKYTNEEKTYKMFSRAPATDDLLDQMFSGIKETIRIDWPAYPHYEAPEVFAPIILDRRHLYYINSFENAASAIETGAVAAENVARLIISRLLHSDAQTIRTHTNDLESLHIDL
ncbi:prenylcysteine oxidase / farnesylcysteine lyase protein [Dioscorea alata]|uniref:Prenylcysteine oxidase / farnesylcysteine lyase protein n=1 Tax=Dioscorea alata TaxID=55571 RepID=A0ACB7WBK3_DIOAL|nr:prenylcysteine oxidase / farnesylcysteine lyase protein [Dioscorea alata]